MNERRNSLELAGVIKQHENSHSMGVSLMEIAGAMVDFSRTQNSEGMKNLFNVILEHETKNRQRGLPTATIRRDALKAIDFTSRIASEMNKGISFTSAALLIIDFNPINIGDVTLFCRKALGYSPAEFKN